MKWQLIYLQEYHSILAEIGVTIREWQRDSAYGKLTKSIGKSYFQKSASKLLVN